MYVRAAAARSSSGTPMHLLLVDAPNRALPINGMFHARLEPLRTFVSSYPKDGILRISEKCSRPINGILSDTTSAFTDQPRLCCRKHHSFATSHALFDYHIKTNYTSHNPSYLNYAAHIHWKISRRCDNYRLASIEVHQRQQNMFVRYKAADTSE